ncbi:MAG: hypothetical protein ACRCVW_06555 [Brevinema sp.]
MEILNRKLITKKQYSHNNTGLSPLFIGVSDLSENVLEATGIFLNGPFFQGATVFKDHVPKIFDKVPIQETFTYVISSEEEKSHLISNITKISGRYKNVSGQTTFDFIDDLEVTKTSVSVFKYARKVIGEYRFDFNKQELEDHISKLLDPTTDENKDKNTYIQNIKTFLSTFGYYYISSYQVYSELLASWQINTSSIKEKQKLSADISASLSSGTMDFFATNQLLSQSTEKLSESSTIFRSASMGIDHNTQTINELDEVFNNFDKYTTEDSAKIMKIFIKPWITLSQIATYISQIRDLEIAKIVQELLSGPNVTQEIWDRNFMFRSNMISLKKRIELTLEDPFAKDFWGNLYQYKNLPIDKIKNIVYQIDHLLEKLDAIQDINFADDYIQFEKQYIPEWEKIYATYMNLIKLPVFIFNVETGFAEVDPIDPTLFHYLDGEYDSVTIEFNAKDHQPNDILFTGHTFYRPYPLSFSSAWEQGAMLFKRIPDPHDKLINPFVIEIQCRLSWTLHSAWSIKSDVVRPLYDRPTYAKVVYNTNIEAVPLIGKISLEIREKKDVGLKNNMELQNTHHNPPIVELVFSNPNKTISNYKQAMQLLRQYDIRNEKQYLVFVRSILQDNKFDQNIEKIIMMESLNFKIVGVSFDGYDTPLLSYNYPSILSNCSGDLLQYFCGPINYNQELVAKCVLIAFIAEAARSKIVEQSFYNFISNKIKQINLDRQKQFLYTVFDKVCVFNGYKDHTNNYTPYFRALELDDYKRFYQSSVFKGDKITALKMLDDIVREEAKA